MIPTLLNQRELAEHMHEEHGIDITPAEISVLCKFGFGPHQKPHGNQRVCTVPEADRFAGKLLSRNGRDGAAGSATS